MRFERIEKKDSGAFLHRYDLHYTDPRGNARTSEMVSRDPQLDSYERLLGHTADAVAMILTDREDAHFVLIHEFRMELGRKIYGLPAGLIDPGETVEQCAARELREETGLRLTEIREILPSAYCAVGLSDEKTICVLGTAEGTCHPSGATGEEIEAGWYTREEIRALHRTEPFGSWALAYSWMWANRPKNFTI